MFRSQPIAMLKMKHLIFNLYEGRYTSAYYFPILNFSITNINASCISLKHWCQKTVSCSWKYARCFFYSYWLSVHEVWYCPPMGTLACRGAAFQLEKLPFSIIQRNYWLWNLPKYKAKFPIKVKWASSVHVKIIHVISTTQ